MSRVIVWFSCGAASAITALLALQKYDRSRVRIIYCDTSKNEHPDNQRFRNDVQEWLKHPIEDIRSTTFSTIEEVFQARKFMSSPYGAPCTVELKKKPRFAFQRGDDIHCFGYTADEKDRIREFEQSNIELLLDWLLLRAGKSKNTCLYELRQAGIKLPAPYEKGYNHTNCVGCVKATSPKYWAMVRRDDPDVFKRRCEQSRELGAKLLVLGGERVFLDLLPGGEFRQMTLEDISCGPHCAPETT